MAVLRLNQFAGEFPAINPQRLEAHQATVARNVKLTRKALTPVRGTDVIQRLASSDLPRTIFKYSSTIWLEFSGDLSVVKSPVANDAYGRVIIVGGGEEPRVTSSTLVASGSAPYPSATLRLGVPKPSTPIVATVTGTATDPDSLPETRFYTFTYVNSWGEEGPPPEDTSQEVNVRAGQSVELTLPGAPSGNYDIVTQRVYRTNGSVFQWVADVPISTLTTTDTTSSADLGEAMPSAEWDEPPADLEGVVNMPGGFCAGWRNNEILFSEPGLPHAWPVKYRQNVDYDIVGLGVFGGNLVVCTNGFPYLVSGSSPASMSLSKLPFEQACVSKTGIVSIMGGVIYPTPDGLAFIGSGTAQLLTQGIVDRDSWQQLNPSSIKAVMWERRYLALYNVDGEYGALAFDPSNPELGITMFDIDECSAVHSDLIDDALYLAINGYVLKWDSGSDQTLTWRSAEGVLSKPMPVRVANVLAEGYPVTLKIYADDELQASLTINSSKPVRVPHARRAKRYSFEVSAGNEVTEIAVASTMRELQTV